MFYTMKKNMDSNISKSSCDIAIFLRNLNGGGAERACLNLAEFFFYKKN